MIFSIIGIILAGLSLVIVTFNVAKQKWYPYLLYFSALFMAYSTTMVGLSVVGSDICRELLMSNLALQNGWDLSLYDPSNTSVLVGLIIPLFSKLTYVPTIWIYKAILPLIFAFTPVIMYQIFKPMIGDLKSFYAGMFFVIMPVFNLEIATIAKSMVAEPIMLLTIWFILQDMPNLKKFLIILGLTLLTLWVHYTVGLILCIYLVAFCGYSLLVFLFKDIRPFKKTTICQLKNGKKFIAYFVVLIISASCFALYYSNVAGGLIFDSSTGVVLRHDYSQSAEVIKDTVAIAITKPETQSNATKPQTVSENKTQATQKPIVQKSTRLDSTVKAYSLVSSALGLDIMKLTPSGVAFRIIQMLTQILVVIGFIWMIFKRKLYNFKSEYLVGCIVAFGLLGLCILVPAFASLINATRQYHMVLFFLAPCFVLAFDAIGSLFKKNLQ